MRRKLENEHDAIVQLLLEHNIDPNIKDSVGRTLLFRAVQAGNVEVTKKLLGICPYQLKVYTEILLYIWQWNEDWIVEWLCLRYGADVKS